MKLKNLDYKFTIPLCVGAIFMGGFYLYLVRLNKTGKFSLKEQNAYYQMQDSLSQRYDNLWDKIIKIHTKDDGIFSPEEQIEVGRKLDLINDSTEILKKPYVFLGLEKLQLKVEQLETAVESFESEK